MRVGVVGARRVRQGIGEFVAREVVRAGGQVPAIVGTSEASLAQAKKALAERYGIDAKGYGSVEGMLAGERLDAVAICSPIEAHEGALTACLAARVHVLCEKPVLADPPRPRAPRIRELLEGYAAAGLHLSTLAQWPHTLDAFRRLYPDADLLRPPRTFAMRISPLEAGTAAIIDCLPHPLSMLRALAGPGRARFLGHGRTDGGSVLSFAWGTPAAETLCELSMRRKLTQPKPSSYAIDGRGVARGIRMPSYEMELRAAGGRTTPLADPLMLKVKDFLARAGRAEAPEVDGIVNEYEAMDAILCQDPRRLGPVRE